MAETENNPGKNYRLRQQETSFYDDETGLTVTRSQEVRIDKGRAGRKTLQMIKTGGLLAVDSSAAEAAPRKEGGDGAGQKPADELSADFPGQKLLAAAGVTTRSRLERMTREEIIALDGIGPKTAAEIEAALGRK